MSKEEQSWREILHRSNNCHQSADPLADVVKSRPQSVLAQNALICLINHTAGLAGGRGRGEEPAGGEVWRGAEAERGELGEGEAEGGSTGSGKARREGGW